MKMEKSEKPLIQKLFWHEIRNRVAEVQPEFARLIDKIGPGKEFPLYLVDYPYGNTIVENGKCYYPLLDGQMVTINDSRIPKEMREDLAYVGTEIPAGIIINNSIELFVNFGDRTFPWLLYKAGAIFGLWSELNSGKTYHPVRIFNITAGARSIFMIPNIGDFALHKNLQRDYNLRLQPPKDLLDQWQIFKALTRHPLTKCNWHASLLFFSGKWLEKLNSNDSAWSDSHRFLLRYAWNKTAYWRNQLLYHSVFSWVQLRRNLKPNPYLADTVKFILAIIMEESPGFTIATDNSAAPIELLQTIYLENYRLKNYAPTMMQPDYFSINNAKKAIYYSLQMPTAWEFSPKSRKLTNTLHDLRELQHVTSVFLDEIQSGGLLVEDTAIGRAVNCVSLDYFHSKLDRHGDILPTKLLPKEDPNMLKCPLPHKRKQFADTGTFLRGCVRISLKKQIEGLE